MNNSQIISTAMAQSATDLGCAPEDFIKDKILSLNQQQTQMRENI